MTSDEEIYSFLEHHGVKGQKWGVRNKDESSDESSSVQAAIKKNPPPKLSAEQKKLLAINEKKHDAHFDKSEAEPEKKGWRPTKKQIALIGVGAVVAAGITAGAVYKIKSGQKPSVDFTENDYLNAVRKAATPGWVNDFSGKHMEQNNFIGLVNNSKGRVWTGQHITAEAFSQKPIEFEKGHTFLRLSRMPEKTFNKATYAVPDEADFGRYVNSFENIDGLGQKISFQAAEKVKIPDLTESLNVMRRSMVKNGIKNPKPQDVLEKYSDLSGGGWMSGLADNFRDQLVSDGYSGIIDQMDAGVYGEAPLVLLDRTKFTTKVAQKLTKVDYDNYADVLTDIPNRR